MGAYKRLIEDYADLQTQQVTELPDRWAAYDAAFEAVCDDPQRSGFVAFVKTLRIVRRIQNCQDEHRKLRWATKLWNAIDCLSNPEACWALMSRELPEVFYDGSSANCMRFTY